MSRLVTIAVFYEIPAAHCAKSFLEAYGIPCFLQDDHLIGQNWLYFQLLRGIKLHCLEDHFEEARELLVPCYRPALVEAPPQAAKRKPFLSILSIVLTLPFVVLIPFWMRRRHWIEEQGESGKRR